MSMKETLNNMRNDKIQIKSCEVLSELPDLFVLNNGDKVETIEQWARKRQEMIASAVDLQYGTMPPDPEFVEVEPLDRDSLICNFRITTGRKSSPLSFVMRVILPSEKKSFPAIINGDLCWEYAFDREYIEAVTNQGIMLVLFNRTELAADLPDIERKSPLYRAYPEYSFGAVAAWAWGFSRCVDALQILGLADMEHIAFNGHSRGGKAALLAGALDSRACVVNPNNSGAGGAGCYRVHMTAQLPDGKTNRSEQLSDLLKEFPEWFSKDLAAYRDKESELPFDQHYIKSLVAPRLLLQTEAAEDIWANPLGTLHTTLAAKEAYRFLGAEDQIVLCWRDGAHHHTASDIGLLAKVLMQKKQGLPVSTDPYDLFPFAEKEQIFSWLCPKKMEE